MGFLKKVEDIAQKGAKESAKKGYGKAKKE